MQEKTARRKNSDTPSALVYCIHVLFSTLNKAHITQKSTFEKPLCCYQKLLILFSHRGMTTMTFRNNKYAILLRED